MPQKSADRIPERYKALARELVDERGGEHAHGAQTSAAKALGVSKSHLNKILAGTRRAGVAAAEKAARQLGFRMDYFTAERARSYKAFPSDKAAELPVGAAPGRMPAYGPVYDAIASDESVFRDVIIEAHRLLTINDEKGLNAVPALEIAALAERVSSLRFVGAAAACRRARDDAERRRLGLEMLMSLSRFSVPFDPPLTSEELIWIGLRRGEGRRELDPAAELVPGDPG